MPPRLTGLAAAAGALRLWEKKQELISNNLANANTTGFKAERSFAQLLGDVTPVIGTRTDMSGGAVRTTGNALDLALEGDGFLVIGTPTGERLTRGGELRLDDANRLVTADGHPVLGEHGEIHVPPKSGALVIARDGTIAADGRPLGRLRLEGAPTDGVPLQREGAGRWVPGATRPAAAPGAVRVRQGALEESNVNPIGTLVDMITAQRAYASIQKAVTTMDAVRGTAVTDLGRPV